MENKIEQTILKHQIEWDTLCDWLGERIANDKDCENGCEYDILKKVNEIRAYGAARQKIIKNFYNYLNEKGYLNIENWAIDKVLDDYLTETKED